MGNRGERRMQSPARLVALLPSASRHARNLHAGPRGSGRSWRVEFIRVGLYFVAAAWGPSASKAVGGDARRTGHPRLPTDWQPAVRRRSGERIELLQPIQLTTRRDDLCYIWYTPIQLLVSCIQVYLQTKVHDIATAARAHLYLR